MLEQVTLKKFQDRFLFSRARHPAMISAWGTGKTMLGIARAMVYSEWIPENLGVIFRREFCDLRDSTLKDFETYTGMTVDSQRNVDFPNGSRIMFRHLEEMNNIQNLNLGWFFIEQAEELRSDEQFFKLWGRLRRKLQPNFDFINSGMAVHTGFIIGNVAGSNWIRHLWKDNPKEGFELIEATTFDNADVLPESYLKGLKELEKLKPDIFRRFVMNDWEVEAEGKVLKPHFVDACVGGEFEEAVLGESYVLGVDLAKYQDFTVLTCVKRSDGHVVYHDRFNETSWTLQKARIIEVAKRYNNAMIVPDSTGVGDPIVEDLQRAGCNVFYQEGEREGFVFNQKSKEQLIEKLIIVVENKKVTFPYIEELVQELKDFEVEISQAGHLRYNAPQGKHDDCVISLALAVWEGVRDDTVLVYQFQ